MEGKGGRRAAAGYVVVTSIAALVIGISLSAGSKLEGAPNIEGRYRLQQPSACLPDEFELSQSGRLINLEASEASGRLRLRDDDIISGEVECTDGSSTSIEVHVQRSGADISLDGSFGADFLGPPAEIEGSPETLEERSGEETFGRLMLALAAVILAARFFGAAVSRIGQPHVMGEVLAGILLGPTLLGEIAPGVADYLFPADIIPLLGAGADIGLAFYMFLVGLELDPRMLKGRVEQTAFISHASTAVAMAAGIAVALPLYSFLGPSDKSFAPFAVFMGVSMSITAFPVLARILLERRMMKSPIGVLAIGAAAADDVSAWGLLAFATAIAGTGTGLVVLRILAFAVAFCAVMALVVRPLLARVSAAYDEAGHIPTGWIATIFVGVLLSAFASQQIGIAAIFGAFVMGLIMPRRADLTHEVTERLEDFVVTVLLPLFFFVTGLKTQIGLIDRPVLWIVTFVLIGVAVACKWLGAMGAAKFAGLGWRESSAIGALMNTRGLTELIVLTIGLELGVMTPALFTMLVLMALVTTFMTGPALRLIDPKEEFSARPEDTLRVVEKPVAERSILVAPQDEKSLDSLIAIAEPLARSEPQREMILARILAPTRTATGIASEERELAEASRDITSRRKELIERGFAARAVAFTSPAPGADLVRLASADEIDLLLLDGRRPLLGAGVPRGDVGIALADAPCDVAVLVERGDSTPDIGPDRPVVVPFGGADHDWAALELGAWISFALSAPLKLLGAKGAVLEGKRDASRLLANTSLVVQQLVGVAAEPLLAEPGRAGILESSEGAGLLVVGLSDRWREEGLGPVRSEIARSATAAVLFVRRGRRAGALAPPDDVTRFAWSKVGTGGLT